ncbi:hypothetical protein H4R35_003962, partial [Dimargaris xerosporica]
IRESIAQLTRLYESDQTTSARPTETQPVLNQGRRSPCIGRYNITPVPIADVFRFCPDDYDDGPHSLPVLETKPLGSKTGASQPSGASQAAANHGRTAPVVPTLLTVSPSKRKAASHTTPGLPQATAKPNTTSAVAESKPAKVSRLTGAASYRTTAHGQALQSTTRPRLGRQRSGPRQPIPAPRSPTTHQPRPSTTATQPSASANPLTRSQSAHSSLTAMPLDASSQALPAARTSVKITYGKARSFQGQEPTQAAATSYWDISEQQDILAPTQPTFQLSSDSELVENPDSNITLALEERKWMHEINALLTDVQRHQPLPQRQQACVRLTHFLATVPSLISTLSRTSKTQQLYNTLHLQTDPLVRTTWLFFVYHLFACPTTARGLITERQALDVVADYLRPHRDDLLQAVIRSPATASKLARELVGIISQSLRHSLPTDVVSPTPQWSWQDLALWAVFALCLGKLSPTMPLDKADAVFAPRAPYPLGVDQPIQIELRVSGCLAFLAQIVVDQVLALVSLQPGDLVQPKKLADTLQALDPVWRCVSVLEYATVSVTENVADLLGQHRLLERLVQLLEVYGQLLHAHHLLAAPKALARPRMADATLVARCANDSLVVIRLLVNLTNQQPDACSVLSQPSYVYILGQMLGMSEWLWPLAVTAPAARKAMRTRCPDSLSCYRNLGFDCVMLTVGLLINLVEETPGARDCLREVTVGLPHTVGNVANTSLLQYATDLFVHLQSKVSQVEDKVLTAYLAVLLGCSMDANTTNQRLIRQWLPGHSFASVTDLLVEFLGPNPTSPDATLPPDPADLASLSMASPVSPSDAFTAALQDPKISTEALLKLHSQGEVPLPNQPSRAAHASHDESDVMQSFRRIVRLLKRLDEPS